MDSTPPEPSREPIADAWVGPYVDALAGGSVPKEPVPELPEELRERYRRDRAFVELMNGLLNPRPDARTARETIEDETPIAPEQETVVLAGARPRRDGAATDDGSGAGSAALTLHLPGFQILGEVGRGGMGVVFRAIQLRLRREVAIKVLLPGGPNEPARIERFRKETTLAAAIVDAGILPILDAFEVDGLPVMVMPYVDGHDLARIMADRRDHLAGKPADPSRPRHPWAALAEPDYVRVVLRVLDRLVDAVAVLHAKRVIHRDIKPSNVLVDGRGNVWLTDFGLARLSDEESTLTATGAQLGSPGYMSPEQWERRRDLDRRVDVFGLGATIYAALTLQLPYGTGPLNARSAAELSPCSTLAPTDPDIDGVIAAALVIDRRDRYASGGEFARDWNRVRRGFSRARSRPGPGWMRRVTRRLVEHRWGVSDLALLICLVGLVGLSTLLFRRSDPPRPTPLTRTVSITTIPARARVVLVPLDPDTGDPDGTRAIRPPADSRTPVTLSGVPPGTYLVEAAVPGSADFHQVYRTVPSPGINPSLQVDRGLLHWSSYPHASWGEGNGVVMLPPITIPRGFDGSTMARFGGAEAFPVGHPDPQVGLKVHPVSVAPFLLDPTEVSAGRFSQVMGGLPEALREQGKPFNPEVPVTYITHDAATAFAERVGKRLPTEEEYEFAATDGGRRLYPWGDSVERLRSGAGWMWFFGPVGAADPSDRIDTRPPVFGLFSNAAEWTSSRLKPYPIDIPGVPPVKVPGFTEKHVVRGGAVGVPGGEMPSPALSASFLCPQMRLVQLSAEASAGVGFRCARSERPRFLGAE